MILMSADAAAEEDFDQNDMTWWGFEASDVMLFR